jgi:proteasome beta subunit
METLEKVKEYMKGTTTVGLVCKDGVVFASDKRATMGTLVAHKIVHKSFMVDKHIGATVAGSVADAQALIRWMQAEAKLFRMRKGEEMSVKAAATLLGNILFSNRYFPMIVQLILGGYDKEGASLYSIDPLGSAIKDKMFATGSGSPMALGLLEDSFKEDLSVDEGIKLAVRAIKVATERDVMTGNGIDVVKITKKGFEKLSEKEVEELIKTL